MPIMNLIHAIGGGRREKVGDVVDGASQSAP